MTKSMSQGVFNAPRTNRAGGFIVNSIRKNIVRSFAVLYVLAVILPRFFIGSEHQYFALPGMHLGAHNGIWSVFLMCIWPVTILAEVLMIFAGIRLFVFDEIGRRMVLVSLLVSIVAALVDLVVDVSNFMNLIFFNLNEVLSTLIGSSVFAIMCIGGIILLSSPSVRKGFYPSSLSEK